MTRYDFDLFVLGAGSGGVRAARKASEAGARVAIAESDRLGGTCVIRGCVPKKLFVYASHFHEDFEDAAGYGWQVGPTEFDWSRLVANKDAEIARLEGLYRDVLDRAGVTLFETRAALAGPQTIRLYDGHQHVTARYVLIATGGRPSPHPALPGHQYTITSNEAFHLDRLPNRMAIAGGGYIAIEFAGIFAGLGVETSIVYRGKEILSKFDTDLRRGVHSEYERRGIAIRCHEVFERIERCDTGSLVGHMSSGERLEVDMVMLAIGRRPNTEDLGLETVGIETDPIGAIPVDEFSATSADGVWAIGDVTNRMQLTPVAIHEAMCFVDTVFGNRPTAPDYTTVPTAVFSQPEIGTVGLSEDEAIARFVDLDIYRTEFRPMKHTLSGRQEKMLMKLVVEAGSGRVLGAHVMGPGAGEMAQILGIPVKMGATKGDFDATMAVHPTAAEELVTFAGPSKRIRGGKPLAA